ncbi:MAG TPA: type II CAAX endopeptidase family protein [Lachnospiraceae bacterium]|nr:type II CAAX endopeptidase family protein [Lachnospiraceae bacterium]
MNAKKSGWLFLMVICIYIAVTVLLSKVKLNISLTGSLFLSEAIIWIPTLLFLFAKKVNPIKFCRFKKLHFSTVLMTFLFSLLVMPAATLMNVISMFFVDNAIAPMTVDMLSAGFIIMFFMVAIHAPLAEEFVFRGAIFQSCKNSASPLKAILLSALLFGLMHLNLNQAGYAFVLGIAMALLVEATDSIWASFICHLTVNARSVVTLFGAQKLSTYIGDLLGTGGLEENLMNALNADVTNKQLFMMLCFEVFMVAVCLPVAGCVLVWIAKKEGREANIRALWKERKAGKVFSVPVLLAILISAGFMAYAVLLI